jgi:hypothetical protein
MKLRIALRHFLYGSLFTIHFFIVHLNPARKRKALAVELIVRRVLM